MKKLNPTKNVRKKQCFQHLYSVLGKIAFIIRKKMNEKCDRYNNEIRKHL